MPTSVSESSGNVKRVRSASLRQNDEFGDQFRNPALQVNLYYIIIHPKDNKYKYDMRCSLPLFSMLLLTKCNYMLLVDNLHNFSISGSACLREGATDASCAAW